MFNFRHIEHIDHHNLGHEERDCHVGKFVRASPCLCAFGRLCMYVLDCVCVLAPAPVLVVGGVLECSPACACACVCQSVARSCACTCACKCVRLCVLARAHACASRVCIMSTCACMCLCTCLCMCVLCGSCVDHMDFLCVLVYATRNTCGNNATDEKLKKFF